jgi:hypothetical protein
MAARAVSPLMGRTIDKPQHSTLGIAVLHNAGPLVRMVWQGGK